VVRTQTVNGWFSFNEGPSGSVGTADLVQGPAQAGTGSAKLVVDATGRASLGTNQFKGTRLDQITGLDFWVYVPSSAGNGYPVVQFDVDYNLNDASTAYQGRLSGLLPPVPLNTWTQVNVLAGQFYATQGPGNVPCGQATPCTKAQILANFPNAGIRNDPSGGGALLIRLGGPTPPSGATVYADALTFSTPLNTTIVDFEPGVTLQPNQGPPGTVVTVKGYGFKPNKPVRFLYTTYAKGKKLYPLCNVQADPAGVATCVAATPTGVPAGNVGVHPILVKGKAANGGALTYSADFFRTP
jgi:hypothetical protein